MRGRTPPARRFWNSRFSNSRKRAQPMNDGNVTQKTETVWRRIEESVRWFGTEMDGRIWFAVLIPVLLAGLFYVVWMYIRDSRAVGCELVTCLGMLRCA